MTDTPWRTPGNPDLANTQHDWMPADTRDNWIGRGRPSIYDDTSFDYRYNEYGWRCDSMADPLSQRHRAIWCGCSVTEGIGLPVDAVWGNLMTQRLREELDDPRLPYWCVAMGGRSQDFIARQMALMIPLLRPQVAVVHLPDPSRRELWWNDRLQFWWSGDESRPRFTQSILNIWNDHQIVHDSQKNIMLIHNTCKAHAVLLRWHCWLHGPYDAQLMYQRIRDGLPAEVQACHFNSAPRGGDIARDGMHGGPETHRVFVDELWSEIGQDLLARMR